jgi:uncharacterized membrane protein YeaQ/YmgE (transglycosylase-associated protein family)
MPATFSIGLDDLIAWALIGLVGGLVGGLVVRGGSLRFSDALFGLPGALLAGILTEFVGLRESGETVAASVAAFFGAMILTVVLRLIPWKYSA